MTIISFDRLRELAEQAKPKKQPVQEQVGSSGVDNKYLLRAALSELISAQKKIFDAQEIEVDAGRRRALGVLSLLLDKAISKLAVEPLRDGLGWIKSRK